MRPAPETPATTTLTATMLIEAAPLATSPATSSPRRRHHRVLAGVAAAALAALVVSRVAHAPVTRSASAVASPAAPAAAPLTPSPPPAVALAVEPGVLDPGALPTAPEAPAPAAPAPAAGAPARSAVPSKPAAAPVADAPALVTEADLAAAAGKDPGDLGDAMRSAVGPRTDDKAGAEASANNGARQLRPSQGALLGAINSVLPAARACLGPDDAVRNGSLVFRSDGSVVRVDMRGSKSEDECVRTALAKARVEAFADDTFTTRVTVRP